MRDAIPILRGNADGRLERDAATRHSSGEWPIRALLADKKFDTMNSMAFPPRARALGFVAHLSALACASAAVCAALDLRDLSPGVVLTAASAAGIALAPLFWRQSDALAELIAWCIAAALVGPLLATAWVSVSVIAAVRTGALAALWLAILHAPLWAGACRIVRSGAAGATLDPLRVLIVTVLAALAGGPLWLAPLASLNTTPAISASSILAVSPLIHLAVGAGADLLRVPWWYAHSTLGSSRFDYPDYLATALVDLLLATLSWLLASLGTRGRSKRTAASSSLLFNPDPESLP